MRCTCISCYLKEVDHLTPQEAIALLRRRIHDFNACVPYGGVSPGARPDEALLPALFALLPTPLAVGISVAPPETQVMQVSDLSSINTMSAAWCTCVR